jgi:hypothetical protein
MSAIRVILLYGKGDKWPSWSEKFLDEAKHCVFKHVLLGKLTILKTDEVYEEESKEGKKKRIITDLNELAYSELILSIDDKTSNGKVEFTLIKACKIKLYQDGNEFMAWKCLKSKLRGNSVRGYVTYLGV